MLRGILWLFAVTLILLVALTLLPEESQVMPDEQVRLHDARVVLYPRADTEAIWYFGSPEVSYSPADGTAMLTDLSDGRRTVAGETDFTLHASALLIDASDNLSGEQLTVHLLQNDECLLMLAQGGEDVVINQDEGLFLVPLLHIEGAAWGNDNQWQRVRASFDLEQFSAGGPGTVTVNEFLAGDGHSDVRRTACDI